MRKIVFISFLIAGTLMASSCEEIEKEFLEKSGFKGLHLKIKNWTDIKPKIDELFPGNSEAEKCILRNNKSYPNKDKV